jgi:hypothetical protein
VIGIAVLAVNATACTGSIGDAPGAGTGPNHRGPAGDEGGGNMASGSASGSHSAGAPGSGGSSSTPGSLSDGWPTFRATTGSQLRQLTAEQYVQTVKTLLGVGTNGMPPIEGVSPAAGFSAIGASTASVSAAGVGQFESAARFFAKAVFAPSGPRSKVVPCTPSGVDDEACFKSFVTSFGQKAFRRPLTSDEIARYTKLTSDVAAATSDAAQGLEATLSAFLQSPNFLYLPELGTPDPTDASRNRYDGYEMASRLSYFLTNDTPDDTMMSSAASGALLTTDGIAKAVERLLDQPAAHDAMKAFFTSLLSLDNLDSMTRPVELFPKFTRTLGPAMKQETLLGIDDLVFGRDGDYRSLFDQPDTFVNAELSSLYGVPAPKNGFARVTLPESSGRRGLLGQAGVLAARDHSDGTSPTKRGLFVLTRLLCQDLPLMPPANLTIPPLPTGNMTARQRLEQHVTNDVCASCHSKMDPVGLSLEHFDAMGVYRDEDHGLAIDDSGEIDGIDYHGVAGLGAVLHDHPALGPCLIQSLYQVAVGRLVSDFDHDSFAALVDEFDANGGRIRSLVAAIASSDGFRYLPAARGK